LRKKDDKAPAPPKVDKRGFPVGDPRAKGGTENDVGLQVGPLMWRFPTNWPYPEDFYDVRNADPPAEYFDAHPEAEAGPFIPAGPNLDALHAHLQRHLPTDARVLDLGAGADTPLPPAYVAKELVGVGASAAAMAQNPKLTGGATVLDLNDPQLKLPFEDNSFDAVVCTSSMEFFTEPRRLFKEVYRVLKPKGMVQVAFTSEGAYDLGLTERKASYWQNFTDAQKMYVAGSFFQFSAGGWSQLKGYDLTPDAGAEAKTGFAKLLSGGDDASAEKFGMFVVSSLKAAKPPADATPLRRIAAELWDEDALLPDERRLCAERLNARHNAAVKLQGPNSAEAQACLAAAPSLGVVYKCLAPMAKVLPVPIRATLAANLAPSFSLPGADAAALEAALLEGLGLTPPQPELWKPLGALTSGLIAEDKIWLLVDVVPCFGFPGSERHGKLKELVKVLTAAQATLAAALDPPDDAAALALAADPTAAVSAKRALPTGDLQLLAAELAVTDFLLADGFSASDFDQWLRSVPAEALRKVLADRKAFNASAKAFNEAKAVAQATADAMALAAANQAAMDAAAAKAAEEELKA
jgi:SAM-dependent methyltransferase